MLDSGRYSHVTELDDWWTRSIEYDERSNTYRVDYSGESLATAIIMAVSVANDCDCNDLPTLYDVIDPDALETVFSPFEPGSPNAQVSFSYAECRVTVRDDNTLIVQPSESMLLPED